MKIYKPAAIGMMREKACGITGHRPDKLGGYYDNSKPNLIIKREIGREIERMYGLGYRYFVSGFAIGADLYFAEEVLRFKDNHPDVHLVAYIPLEPSLDEKGNLIAQEAKWPSKTQGHYHSLLEQCSSVHYTAGPGYVPWKMQHRNKKLAENVSAIIAVWDGSEGGTRNFIMSAKGMEHIKHWVRINPKEFIN